MRSITNEFDTIAAISTPAGEGALHIVRLSGSEALAIADKVYRQGKKHLSEQDSHTIHYGHLYDPKTEQMIDEVMVSVMRAPKTYTREDVVEINCHGGIIVANRVLEVLLQEGARLAEPGEFTKRAFLNGRIDLSQAEAVIDIIKGKTTRSVDMAMHQLQGGLADQICNVRQKLFDTLGEVEVNIDYPEYDDVEEVTTALLKERTAEVKTMIQSLLDKAAQGKILRDGLATAIIGRPNVGKSSLLNELLQEEKAIVTNIAGTTRDVIEEYANVNGVPLKLIDTAGIRETEDIVEQIGVQKSREALQKADFILLLINRSEALTQEDKALLEATQNMERLILFNKGDLEPKLTQEDLKPWLQEGENVPVISAKSGEGMTVIGEELAKRFFNGHLSDREMPAVSNTRHIHLLKEAMCALDEVKSGIDLGLPVDLVQMDVRRAWELLGEIIGESTQDEMLDQLFGQFCLGK